MSRGGTVAQRTSQTRVLERLRRAARKGDHAALALALDEMRTLAFSPRYWTKYLGLLRHPLARLVDLLVIKQGEKIARQKGWTIPARGPSRPRPAKARPGRTASLAAKAPRSSAAPSSPRVRRRSRSAASQTSLFPDL